MIIYTSGTTGRPKGALHTHCGFPIKAAQDMLLGFDVRREDVIYWVTDMGWMMGPWEVFGTTLLGATMVLYEGALDFPGPDRLWSLVEQHRVSILGVSPTLIRSLMRHGDRAGGAARSFQLAHSRLDRASLGIPTRGSGIFDCRRRSPADHQLFRRHRDFGGSGHGKCSHAAQALLLFPVRCRVLLPMWWMRQEPQCADRSASSSSVSPGSA